LQVEERIAVDRKRPLGIADVQVRFQREGGTLLGWWRRRQLSDAGRRRLVIALARAEQELVELHVENALELFDAIGEEIALDRVIEVYLDAMDVAEPRASIVARKVLARLEATSPKRRRSASRRMPPEG
jgi:hypothetical protein